MLVVVLKRSFAFAQQVERVFYGTHGTEEDAKLAKFSWGIKLLVTRSQKGEIRKRTCRRSVKAWGKVAQYKAKAKLYSIRN